MYAPIADFLFRRTGQLFLLDIVGLRGRLGDAESRQMRRRLFRRGDGSVVPHERDRASAARRPAARAAAREKQVNTAARERLSRAGI